MSHDSVAPTVEQATSPQEFGQDSIPPSKAAPAFTTKPTDSSNATATSGMAGNYTELTTGEALAAICWRSNDSELANRILDIADGANLELGVAVREVLAEVAGQECLELGYPPEVENIRNIAKRLKDWPDPKKLIQRLVERERLITRCMSLHPLDEKARLAELDAAERRLGDRWWKPNEFAAAQFKTVWHIPKILVDGQPCLIGGPNKALKTSIAIDLALTLGKGQGCKWLSKFPVPGPGVRIGFISGESGEATIHETFARAAKQKVIDLSHDNVFKNFRVPRLSLPAELAELASYIRQQGLRVIIIDPLYLGLLAGGGEVNASNLFETGPLLLGVAETCLRAGATPILIHHTVKRLAPNKDGTFEPLKLEDLAFAGFAEFARQWILINRRVPYLEGTGHHELWLRCGGSAGHSSVWGVNITEGVLDDDGGGRHWQPSVMSVEEVQKGLAKEKQKNQQTKAEQRREEERRLVVEVLRTKPGGDTMTQIQKLSGLSGRRPVGPAISDLMSMGYIVECQVYKPGCGKGGFAGYALTYDPYDVNNPINYKSHPSVKTATEESGT